MAFLEQFSDDERDLIVSIPYRAGVWVSQADDSGGVESDYEELNELESILAEKAKGMFESAFVHEVMVETCARQDDWKKWAGQSNSVLDDCKKAVAVISGKLEEKDLDAFRANVMAIGLAVAKAFREFNADAPFLAQVVTEIRMFFEAIVRVINRDNSYDKVSALNISVEEDAALTKLSQALHEGIKWP